MDLLQTCHRPEFVGACVIGDVIRLSLFFHNHYSGALLTVNGQILQGFE